MIGYYWKVKRNEYQAMKWKLPICKCSIIWVPNRWLEMGDSCKGAWSYIKHNDVDDTIMMGCVVIHLSQLIECTTPRVNLGDNDVPVWDH